MNERSIMVFLGAMLYAIGIIATNILIEAPHKALLLSPLLELPLLSLGVFFLSAFFWGRFAYVLLLFCGLWMGGIFPGPPFYAVFSAVPLLAALSGGTYMGENALLDIRSRGNLFDNKLNYIESALFALVLALAVGYLTPDITLDAAFGSAENLLKSMGVV